MDSAKGTRTGSSRARRKIFSCPVCDEVFVDEDSLRRHELTHQNPEGGAAEEAAPPPAEAPAATEAPPAEAPAAAPEGRPVRSLSSVRRQAAAQQAPAAAPAQVEAGGAFLQTDSAPDMPVDPDATVAVEIPGLEPLHHQQESAGGGLFSGAWTALEDFSEWVVRSFQNAFGFVGASVRSGISLAVKGILLLGLAALFVYAGTWFGKVYGPKLWGQGEQPVVPPTRTLPNGPQDAQTAVRDLMLGFYNSIHSKDYKAAYAALSPGWQKVLSFDKFRAGYAQTQGVRCSVDRVQSLPGNRYQLDIRIVVAERGKKQRYSGSYIAVETPQGWKLDEGGLALTR